MENNTSQPRSSVWREEHTLSIFIYTPKRTHSQFKHTLCICTRGEGEGGGKGRGGRGGKGGGGRWGKGRGGEGGREGANYSLQRPATDSIQHSRLSSEICQAESQEVVDDKRLVAAAYGVKIDGVLGPDETHPRTEAIDGNDEEDSYYPQLLFGNSVVPQVLEYLEEERW